MKNYTGIKRNKIKTQMSSNVIFFYMQLVLKINFLVWVGKFNQIHICSYPFIFLISR